MAEGQQAGGGAQDSGLGPFWVAICLFIVLGLIWHLWSCLYRTNGICYQIRRSLRHQFISHEFGSNDCVDQGR